MANKHYDYNTPAEYTYNSAKIEVSGDLATLKENLSNVYARWHLNESSGIVVSDSSGNSRNGTAINMDDSNWVSGKLGNCLSFNGINEYVEFGNIFKISKTTPFSLACWFKTSNGCPTSTYGMMMGKQGFISSQTGYSFGMNTNGSISVRLVYSVPSNQFIHVTSISTGWNDNSWHHIVVTYNGNGLASGIQVYIDNSLQSLTIIKDTLGTGDIIVNYDFQLGARDAVGDYYGGLLDECNIYNKVLTVAEIAFIYNSGIGRENWYYFSDKPTIRPNASWQVIGIANWFAFNETLGVGNEGSIGYNISDDDGVTWYYWNGSAWISGGDSSHYNSSIIIGANIETFSIITEKILFRAFLISNGTQKCELDNNEIVATIGEPPNVYAGTNKTCKDHQTIKPFSDAAISDPNGDIELAHAYYDIEGSGFIEIPKNGYGTLQEAIRNYEYTFNNIGTINCILKITDEEFISNQDNLDIVVSKYTKIINVKDSITDEHLLNFLFDPGDGTPPAYYDSPFSYSWEYGTYEIILIKIDYYDKKQSISVINEHVLNLNLTEHASTAICKASVGLLTCENTLAICTWLEINGSRITTPTNCEIELKDSNGVTKYHPTINNTPTSEGVFLFHRTPDELDDQEVYYLHATICYNSNYYSSIIAVNELIKDLSTNINAIKERTDNLPDDPASETNATANKNEIIAEIEGISLDLSNLDTEIKRILGLTQENFRITATTYNASGLLTSATTKIYPTKADCDANTNPIATYLLTAVYDVSNNCTSYKMTKES
jgi:YD repeat-containing protein